MSGWRHPELAAGRWWQLTLAEQLGHVGSEVSRARRWQGSRPEQARQALERALELFDLTLADPRHRQRPGRLKELARAREVLADHFSERPAYAGDAASLQRYFDAFALAVRRRTPGERDQAG